MMLGINFVFRMGTDLTGKPLKQAVNYFVKVRRRHTFTLLYQGYLGGSNNLDILCISNSFDNEIYKSVSPSYLK